MRGIGRGVSTVGRIDKQIDWDWRGACMCPVLDGVTLYIHIRRHSLKSIRSTAVHISKALTRRFLQSPHSSCPPN